MAYSMARLLLLVGLGTLLEVIGGRPSEPLYFNQTVEHGVTTSAKFSQRYYLNATSFGGAGSPIFVIMGGEGPIPPSVGFLYPFVVDVLAPRHRAMVLQLEHRYYGTSLPFGNASFKLRNLNYLTATLALADAASLLIAIRSQYGCTDRETSAYCPIITIGGSYPGFLSAMMRLRYPAVVDGAYAASPVTRLWSDPLSIDPYGFFRIVTESAEHAQHGCASAVRSALDVMQQADKHTIEKKLDLCSPLPAYLESGSSSLLVQEVNILIRITFANLNAAYYPPGPATNMSQACKLFKSLPAWDALLAFLHSHGIPELLGTTVTSNSSDTCFDIRKVLPSGRNATISTGCGAGCGTGATGESWDYQTCTQLVERISTNGKDDMFLPRTWTVDWISEHCLSRFGALPDPYRLVSEWGFDLSGLKAQRASKIVFTNGLRDGWSASSITDQSDVDADEDMIVINMPNGAHHSDLSRKPPSPSDTPDVVEARDRVSSYLSKWIKQAKRSPHEVVMFT